MNSIINAMSKYDHRQHELSDWPIRAGTAIPAG